MDADHSGESLRSRGNARVNEMAQARLAVQSATLDGKHLKNKQTHRSWGCLYLQSRTRADIGRSVTRHRHL